MPSSANLVIRGREVVLPSGVQPAAIEITDGLISAVTSFDRPADDRELLEIDDELVIMPGLVDTHVHVNEPGRTGWEGFTTATRAAAAGGVTTLIDMPLNSIPPTTTLSGLETKIRSAQRQCFVDVGFWGGVVPGNHRELKAMAAASRKKSFHRVEAQTLAHSPLHSARISESE